MLSLLTLSLLLSANLVSTQQQSCSSFDGGINMCRYENHAGMLRRLHQLEARFPSLARVGSVGSSLEGRDLAYIKVSANVSSRSFLEPMFKYVGNMHGDETTGRQMILYLAEFLLQNYGVDQRVSLIS